MAQDNKIAYYTQDNHLDPKWVDSEARNAASSFCDKNMLAYERAIASSQLRKFYAEVKAQERRWETEGSNDSAFAIIQPMFKLLKAKSQYAYARKVVPSSFRDWLWKHVDSVNSAAEFKAFLLHFEAVVGFSYQWIHD